ncbi:MAG: radical SAM protein, partial [Nitrospinales bacterium]
MEATLQSKPKKKIRRARTRPINILLVYPSTSDVAISNLGFQRVYSLLNQSEGVVCDRYSLPENWTPEGARLKGDDLRSVDSRKLPSEFDMIAFSISFEPDYLNAVTLLDYFNIPLDRTERDASHPLILAGGSAIFINPEPLAEIVDVFFCGEGEQMADPFFQLYTNNTWEDPREILRSAATLSGIYVPRFYTPEYDDSGRQIALRPEPCIPERVKRHWVAEGSADLCTHSEIHDEASAFGNMALMEVTRGCIWACRFCTAGFIYRPPRLPDLDLTYDSLTRVLDKQEKQISTIGLVGPSVTDHPDLLPLARRVVEGGRKL